MPACHGKQGANAFVPARYREFFSPSFEAEGGDSDAAYYPRPGASSAAKHARRVRFRQRTRRATAIERK